MDSAAALRLNLGLLRRAVHRPARGRSAAGISWQAAKQPCRRVVTVQASSHASGKSHSREAIIIPLNYAQLLGLRGREMYVEPQVGAAYEELFHEPLEEGYSNVAKLGKEKLLYAAREGLRGVRGRVSLVPPETSIEPVLLAGALALLEQVGEYQLVLGLAEQAQHLGAEALRSANKETLRDFERDCTLALALAYCGLAREAFDAGQVGPGCARMEEALRLLRSEGGGGGLLGPSTPSLAPKLQTDISEALLELRAEVLLGYLQAAPNSEAALAKRKQAVASLRSMMQLPAPEGQGSSANGASPEAGPGEYLRRAMPCLTSFEVVELLEWERVASNKAAFGWYYPGLLESAAVAHIVAGFAQRRPALIETAAKLLRTVRTESDVAVELAVCEVLLGSPDLALAQLQEDEQIGLALSGKAGVPLPASASAGDFPTRDGVMAFIRRQSPEGDLDLLPGLVLFVERWLQRIAFPRLRDTAQLPPQSSLVAYFQDPQVEKFLERRVGEGSPASPVLQLVQSVAKGGGMAVATLGRLLVGVLSLPARGLHHLQLMGALQPLRWVAAAAVLGAAAIAAGQALQGPRRQLTAMASAPVIAVPSASGQQQQQAAQQGAQQQQQQQQQQLTLTRPAAEQVVKQWLRTKAEAMGPRHKLERLDAVLAEPMLGQVRAEVTEAQAAGWFWNIRPLGVKVESVDGTNLGAVGEGGGYAVVLATVDESADLWATNGKKGDSYKTTYKVEYTVVPSEGAWKIASALVLGK